MNENNNHIEKKHLRRLTEELIRYQGLGFLDEIDEIINSSIELPAKELFKKILENKTDPAIHEFSRTLIIAGFMHFCIVRNEEDKLKDDL